MSGARDRTSGPGFGLLFLFLTYIDGRLELCWRGEGTRLLVRRYIELLDC